MNLSKKEVPILSGRFLLSSELGERKKTASAPHTPTATSNGTSTSNSSFLRRNPARFDVRFSQIPTKPDLENANALLNFIAIEYDPEDKIFALAD